MKKLNEYITYILHNPNAITFISFLLHPVIELASRENEETIDRISSNRDERTHKWPSSERYLEREREVTVVVSYCTLVLRLYNLSSCYSNNTEQRRSILFFMQRLAVLTQTSIRMFIPEAQYSLRNLPPPNPPRE